MPLNQIFPDETPSAPQDEPVTDRNGDLTPEARNRILSQSVERRIDSLKDSERLSQERPSEYWQKVVDLTKRAPFSPEFIHRNFLEVEKRYPKRERNVNQFEHLVREAPKTASWLEKPENWGAVQDTIDEIVQLEKKISRLGGPQSPRNLRRLQGLARERADELFEQEYSELQSLTAPRKEPEGFIEKYYGVGGLDPFAGLEVPSKEKFKEAIFQRELERLKKEEAFVQEDPMGPADRFLESVKYGYKHGTEVMERGRQGRGYAQRQGQQYSSAEIERLSKSLAATPTGEGFTSRWLYEGAKIFGQIADTIPRTIDRAIEGAIAGGTVALAAGQAGPQVALPEEIVTVPAGILAGLQAGFTVGLAEQAFIVESGNAYLDLSELKDANGKGLSEDSKRNASTFIGTINAGLELIGFKLLTAPAKLAIKKAVGQTVKEAVIKPSYKRAFGQFAKGYITSVGGETATEVLQELNNIVQEDIAKQVSGQPFETFANSPKLREQALDRILSIAGATARGTALLGLPGSSMGLGLDVAHVAAQEQIRARSEERQAETTKEAFKILNQGMAKAKETIKSPEVLASLAKAVGEGKVVSVPFEAFQAHFQGQKAEDGTPLDVKEVAIELGVKPETFDNAIPLKANLVMPLDKYLELIPGGPHEMFFQENANFDPGQPTPFEVKEGAKEEAAVPGEAIAIPESVLTPEGPSPAEFKAATKDLTNRLKKALSDLSLTDIPGLKKLTPEKLTHMAGVLAESYRRRAEVLGVDPIELFEAEKIQVTAQEVPTEVGASAPTAAQAAAPVQEGEVLPSGGKVKRGFTVPLKDRILVAFTKEANFSTWLHEVGHVWLIQLGQDVVALKGRPEGSLNEAQKAFLERSEALLEWLGAKSFGKITKAQHEKFAEAVETYFARGKAPSSALKRMFTAFKDWMLQIYGAIRGEQILDPRVSNVLDRLLAGEREIALARMREIMSSPIIEMAKKMGGGKNAARLAKMLEAAEDASSEAIDEKVLEASVREQEAWWQDETKQMTPAAEVEIRRQKEYAAAEILRSGNGPDGKHIGELKISKDALVGQYTKETAQAVSPDYLTEGAGATPDQAAEVLTDLGYPFSSGMELLETLGSLRPIEDAVQELVHERMTEKYGDIMDDSAGLLEEVMRAVYTPEQAAVLHEELSWLAERAADEQKKDQALATAAVGAVEDRGKEATQAVRSAARQERQALAELVREAAAPPQPLKEFTKEAEEEIARKNLLELEPKIFLRAARDAAKEALRATLKGDLETAMIAKERQLKNHERYRAAIAATRNIAAIRKYLLSFDKPLKRQALGKAGLEYLHQIEQILERIDLRRISDRTQGKRDSLVEWAGKQAEKGLTPFIPSKLLKEAFQQNFREIPYEDLLEIRDTVKNIDHLATTKNRLLASKDKREFDATVDAATKTIYENFKGKLKKEELGELSAGQRLARKIAERTVGLRKFSNLVQQLDGFKESGISWDVLVRTLNARQEQELAMRIAADKKLAEIFKVYSKKEKAIEMRQKVFIPEIKDSLSKMDMLFVALNWGNLDNREAVMAGYGWNEEQVQAILDRLDKKDTEVIQAVWDFLDKEYWPQIAELEQRVHGLPLEKVAAEPVETKHGTLRGGYYPLKYKFDPSKPYDSIEQMIEDAKRGGSIFRSTRHGHRNERVGGGGRKVRLDIGVLQEHVRDVTHDLTHYEWLVDANRLLRDPKMAKAIKETAGEVHYNEMVDSVNAIAAGDRQQMSKSDAFFRKATGRVRTAILWGRVSTVLKQFLGLTGTVDKIGSRWAIEGAWGVIGGVKHIENLSEWIKSVSPFMATREVSQTRETVEFFSDIRKVGWGGVVKGGLQSIEAIGFLPMVKAQWLVDKITWVGAYKRSLSEQKIESAKSPEERDAMEKRAVSVADQAVRDSQGSGLLADMPRVMRERGAMRIFTLFKSFGVNRLNLFLASAKRAAMSKSPKDAWKVGTSFMLLYVLPAMIWQELISRAKGGRDKDDEDLKDWLKKQGFGTAKELLGDIPVASELIPAVSALEGKRIPYEGPAGVQVFAESADLAKQIAQWEADEAFWKSALRLSGYATGIPPQQIDQTIEGWQAWEDEQAGPGAILFGPPPRERR